MSVHTAIPADTATRAIVACFDLTTAPASSKHISPHTTKTLLDLQLLGIECKRERLSFTQVRRELAERVAQDVTVPTIEFSDGTYLTGSGKIAEYLSQNHPKGHLIFGGTLAGKIIAALAENYLFMLQPHLWPMCVPGMHQHLDAASAHYFETEKRGPQFFQDMCNTTEAARAQHLQQAKQMLNPIDKMLEAAHAGGSQWLAGSEQPTHADFCLFGVYVYSRTAGAKVSDEVFSAPSVARWVAAMREWVGPAFLQDLLA